MMYGLFLIASLLGISQSADAAEPRLAMLSRMTKSAETKQSVHEQLNQLEDQIKKIRTTLSQQAPQEGLLKNLQNHKPISVFIDQCIDSLHQAYRIAVTSVQFIEHLPSAAEWLGMQVWQQGSYAVLSIFIAKLALALLICLGVFMLCHGLIRQIARRLGRYQALLWRIVSYTFAYGALPYLAGSVLVLLNLSLIEQEIGFLCAMAGAVALLLVHLSQIIFEPYQSERRLVPISSSYATRLHRFIKWFGFVGIGGTYAIFILVKLGMPVVVASTLGRTIAFIILIIALHTIVQLRRLYSQVLAEREPVKGLWVRAFVLRLWHIPFMAVCVAIYLDFCGIIHTAQSFIVGVLLSLAVASIVAIIEDKFYYVRTHVLKHVLRAYSRPTDASLSEYTKTIDQVVAWAAYVIAFLIILELWGVEIIAWLTSGAMQVIVHKLLVIAFIILVVLLILRFSNFLFARYSKKVDRRDHSSARMATVIAILRNSLRVGLWVPAIFLILSELGFDITPLVASFSLISLAVGIGAQNLVKDIITGLFIILEDTVSVGDYVTLDGSTGHVEALTIRTIALRAEDGTLHTIPFSSISRVSNLTRQYAVVVTLVVVSYEQDLDKVCEAMRQAYEKLCKDPKFGKLVLEDLEIKGVDEFRETGVVVKTLIKTMVLRHNDVKRAYNGYLKHVFDAQGIAFAHGEPTQHYVIMKE